MPVTAVTRNFSCGLGPVQQAVFPLLASSVPLNLLLEQLIQRALRGTTLALVLLADELIQYNTA